MPHANVNKSARVVPPLPLLMKTNAGVNEQSKLIQERTVFELETFRASNSVRESNVYGSNYNYVRYSLTNKIINF